jgi:hypothetical protein
VEIVLGAYWALLLDRRRPRPTNWPGYLLAEVHCEAAADVAAAMDVADHAARARFRHGARAWAARTPEGAVAAWLWVSTGRHRDEPIRRELSFAMDEAYGWSAGTLPAHRCRGLFTRLLEQAGAALLSEGRTVMWIGIHDHNLASRRAAVRAGFSPVLRLSALLLGRRRGVLRTRAADYADPELVRRAHRILGAEATAGRRLRTMPGPTTDTRQPAGEAAQVTAPANRRNPE